MVSAPSSSHLSGIDRRKWTPEEDALLTRAMVRFQNCKDIRWTEIAAEIPERSAKACRKRWVNGLNDRLKKGSWTHEEDERLREGVSLLANDWARIADHVGQRSGDQCSKRWREVLDPAINKSTWTPEEDKQLIDLFYKHGSAWQVISTHFQNRRALQCRNRCCKLLSLHAYPRAKKAAAEAKDQAPPTTSPMRSFHGAGPVPISPVCLDVPAHTSQETWPSVNVSSPTEPMSSTQPYMQDTTHLNTMSMPASHPAMSPISPISPMFGMPDLQKSSLPSPSLHLSNENGESGSLLLDSWNKVQGFSALKRKDPPAALNLHGNVSQPPAGLKSYPSPFCHPNHASPSMCSSMSTSPTTPSVADTLSLQNMMSSPMLPPMPNQMAEGLQFCKPMAPMAADKGMSALNWQLYCNQLVPMQAPQHASLPEQAQTMSDMYPVMLGGGAAANPLMWLSDVHF